MGMKTIGRFNVDYCGAAWNGSTKYEMVIISEFDNNDKEIRRYTYYFLRGDGLIIPDFKTEAEVKDILRNYSNNARIKAKQTFITEAVI